MFLNSLNNPKFGASQNLKILIGIPPLDDPMTNLPKKNGWNSLQPPEMELQSLVPTESPSWHHISSRSPGHIHQRIWACHTSLERSRIAFYGYANLCPPNQTIWRLEAIEAIQRWPWIAYVQCWNFFTLDPSLHRMGFQVNLRSHLNEASNSLTASKSYSQTV